MLFIWHTSTHNDSLAFELIPVSDKNECCRYTGESHTFIVSEHKPKMQNRYDVASVLVEFVKSRCGLYSQLPGLTDRTRTMRCRSGVYSCISAWMYVHL